jgi:hypothetical protein
MEMKKAFRWLLIVLGVGVVVVILSWAYTTAQLAHARSKGVYPSAEQGMLALVGQSYPPDRDVKILYAGTNSLDGSKPHVWYVIAEVHASLRADGSELGSNGCDAPGSFFLQTKEGRVHVPESAFPGFIGTWMEVFDLAGPGQAEPSTTWADDQPNVFCR